MSCHPTISLTSRPVPPPVGRAGRAASTSIYIYSMIGFSRYIAFVTYLHVYYILYYVSKKSKQLII
jgi:hypothetical protein